MIGDKLYQAGQWVKLVTDKGIIKILKLTGNVYPETSSVEFLTAFGNTVTYYTYKVKRLATEEEVRTAKIREDFPEIFEIYDVE